tara:strand:+ start:3415 stop:3738 length:324 start_codon:yes stop_codon:yes gene_type:complete
MKALSNFTQPLIENYLSKNNNIEAKLLINWGKIVKEYEKIIFPKKISFLKNEKNNGLLILNVQRGFGTEIQMKIPKLLNEINNYLGYKAISKIKIEQIILDNYESTS